LNRTVVLLVEAGCGARRGRWRIVPGSGRSRPPISSGGAFKMPFAAGAIIRRAT
jgi:hypothetical protein